MIRSSTFATFLLACGSGFYLYQSKHEVQLLDQAIKNTVHDTRVVRGQSRLLTAEWTILNDPETLRRFADRYLALKPITPSQFTSLADLDPRLPSQVEASQPNRDYKTDVPITADTTFPAPVLANPMLAIVADEMPPLPPTPVARPAA